MCEHPHPRNVLRVCVIEVRAAELNSTQIIRHINCINNNENTIHKRNLTINIMAKQNLSFNADSHTKKVILINLKMVDLQPIVSFWSVDSQ